MRRSVDSLASAYPVLALDQARTGFLFPAHGVSGARFGETRPFIVAMFSVVMLVLVVTPPCAHAQVPGEVRGRVSDAESGRAIAGARIDVVAAGRADYAVSDIGGAFVLRGAEPGTFTLRVRAFGHAFRDTVVSVANGRTTTVDIVLQPVVTDLDPIVVRSAVDTTSPLAFSRRTIEQSGRHDLGELLQGAPGVVVTRAGGPGSPSHISIRGSGASEVLVLLDGSPINSPITGEADLSSVGLESIERVRVLPGAQSARYGGHALAGVVVIETRRAHGEESAAASFGAWGERNASVVLGGARPWNDERIATSIAADYRDVRGDFTYEVPAVRGGGTAHRLNADARSVGVLATASIDGSDDQPGGARVRAEWQTRSRGMPGSIVQPSTTGRQRDSRLAGGIDGRWNIRPVVWSANVDATREHAVFSDPSPPFGSVYDDAVDANSLTASSAATVNSANATLTIGSEARTLEVTSTMLDTIAPRRQQQFGTWITGHVSHATASGVELAADASGRGDWDSLLDGASLSPRAALSATSGAATVSASMGSSFAPPSLADQFFHEGVLVRPNPNLQPERVRRELEVRMAVRDTRVGIFDVGGDAAAFRANVDGMILWQPNFQFIWSPSNFDVRRTGWEMNGRVAASAIGVDMRGSISRSDVTYTGAVLSGQVAYRPRSTASVIAGVSRWTTRVELNARYVGSRRTVPGSGLNMLDPYWLTDISATRPIPWSTHHLDVTLGVDNLFNRSAAMLADYPFPGRTWTVALRARRR
jgi:vitamin B12 transporter